MVSASDVLMWGGEGAPLAAPQDAPGCGAGPYRGSDHDEIHKEKVDNEPAEVWVWTYAAVGCFASQNPLQTPLAGAIPSDRMLESCETIPKAADPDLLRCATAQRNVVFAGLNVRGVMWPTCRTAQLVTGGSPGTLHPLHQREESEFSNSPSQSGKHTPFAGNFKSLQTQSKKKRKKSKQWGGCVPSL